MYVFIGLHSLLPEVATRIEVFCKKGALKNFRKFHKKTPLLVSLFKKVAGMTPILKNICQRLLLHFTHTTVTYPFYFIFSTFFLIITVTTQKQSSGGVLLEKVSLEIFAKFTGKHLYQRLFYDKNFSKSPIVKNLSPPIQ